jgi:hypothetical protein
LLIEPDRNELGDKRLNPEEAVIRERESLLQLAAQKKIGSQAELENPDRSLGPRLQYTDIISRLRKIIPDLVVKEGSRGSVALYFPRNRKELEEAQREWEWGKDEFFMKYKYVGGFPKNETFEYSHIDIDSSHLPTKEHRGWRSILIALLKQGVVSYSQLVSQFGDVGTDRRGWRWQEQTRQWRNNPTEKFISNNFLGE